MYNLLGAGLHQAIMITPFLISLAVGAFHVGPQGNRSLVFSQDFSHVKLIDPKLWEFDDGPSYNNEIEKYTPAAAHNAWIEGGNLVIEARKENGKVTSARLESVASWKHPYVEVVAKAPPGRGTWPAIWMLNERLRNPGSQPRVGWPDCGEIDIMENVGFDPPNFHFSLHSGDYNWMKPKDHQRTLVAAVANPNSFHKFALDSRSDTIIFLVDGKPLYTVKKSENTFGSWPFDDPYYLILNLAIGGSWGGAKGVDDAIFPCRYYIKSVKVYE